MIHQDCKLQKRFLPWCIKRGVRVREHVKVKVLYVDCHHMQWQYGIANLTHYASIYNRCQNL